ncbi:MAG: hypothetical protein M1818_007808 [Claussenomyces sp. TS43310]|nr:MAG: hypothetical protein M1818_007808 [Claussenomyces sp. TS43310]
MPPQRTIPPVKAVKTERTHEENQERAYIAASRRSDRSLEARVESARRASEIHKRRTGRSLRVTEQDVINEEMYEEEDDDLPVQYRRLTAHLQTGSVDFNRRLSAYLTNHVAMRSALEQTINQSYAQQFPNAPQHYNQSAMFPSPMMPYQQQSQQPQHHPPEAMYRQPLYPMRMAHSSHQRSASIATPQELNGSSAASPVTPTDHGRRMSVPALSTMTNSPLQARTPLSTAPDTPKARPAVPKGGFDQQSQQSNFMPHYNMSSMGNEFAGFSTALPPESQMLLRGSLDPSDSMTPMFMAGSENYPQHSFNLTLPFNASKSASMKTAGPQTHPTSEGLNSTLAQSSFLAPSRLTMDNDQHLDPQPPSFFDAAAGETTGSGMGTPGNCWDLFMENDKWDLPSASQ